MNNSQSPLAPRVCIGCARPSQLLKSPTTETPRAFGAQTANEYPREPSTHRRPRAHLLPRPQPVAFAEQIGLVVGDDAAVGPL